MQRAPIHYCILHQFCGVRGWVTTIWVYGNDRVDRVAWGDHDCRLYLSLTEPIVCIEFFLQDRWTTMTRASGWLWLGALHIVAVSELASSLWATRFLAFSLILSWEGSCDSLFDRRHGLELPLDVRCNDSIYLGFWRYTYKWGPFVDLDLFRLQRLVGNLSLW